MNRIFLDTNIILDVLAIREPHYHFSASLLDIIVKGQYKGFVSSLSFSNLFYIIRKRKSKEIAVQTLKMLNNILDVASVDSRIINQSLNSEFNDFEDAIQYYSAITNNVDYFITRNIKDFRKSEIPVFTPEEFIKSVVIQDQ